MKEQTPRCMLGKEKMTLWNSALSVIFCIVVALVFLDLGFVRNFFGVAVVGESMEMTLSDGDFLYADYTATPERGDIVIIDVTNYPEFSGTQANKNGRKLIIKRVIALGGDTVKGENWVVSLRRAGEEAFTPLEEPYRYIKESDLSNFEWNDFSAVTVGEGELFVMGDHRSNSLDSRRAGCFKLSDVRGVVPKWALDHKSAIAAWERFRALLGFSEFE